MSVPKLHHYVPQSYLSRFTDAKSRLWVWDKDTDRIFPSSTEGIAAEKHFYRFTDLTGTAKDPLLIENAFAQLEGDIAKTTKKWIAELKEMKPLDTLSITDTDREIMSVFLASQFFRTAETREILMLFALEKGYYKDGISEEERANLHAALLVNSPLIHELSTWLMRAIWIFARNGTGYPFITSDNPVCFKTPTNGQWLKATGIMSEGSYLVYPLAPHLILYCKDGQHPRWKPLKPFADKLSPVELSKGMIDHENSGQVFMATRFVMSSINDFSFPREFCVKYCPPQTGPLKVKGDQSAD